MLWMKKTYNKTKFYLAIYVELRKSLKNDREINSPYILWGKVLYMWRRS